MRLLLDTHAVIWHIAQNPALSNKAGTAIKNPDNEIIVSVVTLWELAIKVSLGKLRLTKPVGDIAEALREGGVAFLQISEEHALSTERLPWHHRDPFDRMLIAQARLEDLILVTRDSIFGAYGISRLW